MFQSCLILLGGVLYRWRGAAHPDKEKFPRPFNQILFAIPFAIQTFLYWNSHEGLLPWLISATVLILTVLGVLTGHGRGLDLGKHDLQEDETLEFLIKWLKPHIPLYWYDMLILSISGLAITLPAGLATLNPALALSGLLKGPAYALSNYIRMGSEGGELLTGAILWGSIL